MSPSAKHDVLVGQHQPAVRLLIESLAPKLDCLFRFVHNRAGLRNEIPLRTPELLIMDKNLPPVNGLACLAEIPEPLLLKTVLLDSTSSTTLNIPLLQQNFKVNAYQSLPTTPREFSTQLLELLGGAPTEDATEYTDAIDVTGGLFASILANAYFFQYSGVMRVEEGHNLRHIHFCRGMPIFMSSARLSERLITVQMIQQQVITCGIESLKKFGTNEFDVFCALVRNRLINEERFFSYLEDYLFKMLINTGRWQSARIQLLYQESPFRVPPHELNLIELVKNITWQTYTQQTLRREYPDLSVRHRRIANPYLPIENFEEDRVIMQFYNLLNGLTDLQTILRSQMYTELEAYRILFLLEQFRLIERVNPQDQPSTQKPFETFDTDSDRTMKMDMGQVFEFLDEQSARSLEIDTQQDVVASASPTGPMHTPFALPSPFDDAEQDPVISSIELRAEEDISTPTKVEVPARSPRDQTIQISELSLSSYGDYDRLGDYLLLKRLAAGGMGEIHLGAQLEEESFDDFVAVKKLLAELCEDDSLITMFRDEARVVSQLDHKNIVKFRDFIRQEEIYYMVMDYIPGKNMRDMIRACKRQKRPLPLEISLHIISQVAEGLHYAHTGTNKRGEKLHLIHRDINPQNVLLSYDGDVKIIDFGIAKTAIQHTVTLVGQIKGKYSYMSPEQVEGKTLDLRSDIFSLGLVLYQLVTGKKCFKIRNEVELLTAIVDCKFPAPREVNPKLPIELEAIVLKCLQKDRDNRYLNTLDLRDVLHRFAKKYGLNLSQSRLRMFLQEIFEEDYQQERETLAEYKASIMLAPGLGDEDETVMDEPITAPDTPLSHLGAVTAPDVHLDRPQWSPAQQQAAQLAPAAPAEPVVVMTRMGQAHLTPHPSGHDQPMVRLKHPQAHQPDPNFVTRMDLPPGQQGMMPQYPQMQVQAHMVQGAAHAVQHGIQNDDSGSNLKYFLIGLICFLLTGLLAIVTLYLLDII